MNVILLEINRSPDPSFNTAYQREMFYDLARDSLSGKVTQNRWTLARPIGYPITPVAQKIVDQRWLIANSAKNKYFFI